MSNPKAAYILVCAESFYRVDSRYKKPYVYAAVAQKNAEKRMAREHADWVRELKWNPDAKHPEKIIVVSEGAYAEMVKDKGEWKTGQNGDKIWIPFDLPHCCDPTSETYMSM